MDVMQIRLGVLLPIAGNIVANRPDAFPISALSAETYQEQIAVHIRNLAGAMEAAMFSIQQVSVPTDILAKGH